MNVAICDDEVIWQKELVEKLNEYKENRHINMCVNCFSDGETCCNSDLHKFDIIFMDYKMSDANNKNGIDISRKIRLINSECCIIFFSAYPQPAIESFEVGTFRYLLKPIDNGKLFEALDDYREKTNRNGYLYFKAYGKTIRIRLSEIIYAEAKRNHTVIFTSNDHYEILVNIKELEKKLPDTDFFRCHRAYITSFRHIKCHNSEEILFQDGRKIFVSRKSLPAFKAALYDYIIKYDLGEN